MLHFTLTRQSHNTFLTLNLSYIVQNDNVIIEYILLKISGREFEKTH